MIAYCAKVSNPKGQMNLETSERVIALSYQTQAPWSPFEMASLLQSK